MTEADLPPDVTNAIAAYGKVFDVKSVRVVSPDEEHGIPHKRWLMDQITRQSEEYLNNPPPLLVELIPKNAKPAKACMGAQASLRPDGALEQLSMDLRPQRTDRGDCRTRLPASHWSNNRTWTDWLNRRICGEDPPGRIPIEAMRILMQADDREDSDCGAL
jgi:hypothetical protein